MVIGNALQKKETPKTTSNNNFIRGKSEVANRLYQTYWFGAGNRHVGIIQGESGTGKEFAARTLHQQSKRKTNLLLLLIAVHYRKI